MNVQYAEKRIILGDPNTTCNNCSAPAAVHYANNGLAEFWHAPTTCCNYAINRERQYNRLTQLDRDRAGNSDH